MAQALICVFIALALATRVKGITPEQFEKTKPKDCCESSKDHKCFQIVNENKYDRESGKQLCQSMYGNTLLHIADEEEQIFVTDLLFVQEGVTDDVWLGYDTKVDNSGISGLNLDILKWANSSYFLNNNELCIKMLSGPEDTLGLLATSNCSEQNVVVCQKPVCPLTAGNLREKKRQCQCKGRNLSKKAEETIKTQKDTIKTQEIKIKYQERKIAMLEKGICNDEQSIVPEVGLTPDPRPGPLDDGAHEPIQHPNLVEKIVSGNLNFVLELYQKCVSDHKENAFMSPFSITTALAMTFMGAKGATGDEIRQLFHLDQTDDITAVGDAFEDVIISMASANQDGLTLLSANGMYVDNNLEIIPEYKDQLQSKFNAVINNVDFRLESEKARIEINSFVENVTRNRIKDLIPQDSIDPANTRLILVNAIYFKGDWQYKFDKRRTTEEKFTISLGKTKLVSMMMQHGVFSYSRSNALRCSMIELPYLGNRISMYILLPKDVDGLDELESNLNKETFSELLRSLKKADVTVTIPKFKIESTFSLKSVLSAMGLRTMFLPTADFSGITTTEPLYVSKVLHKAFLEVSEEGSEAAAATSISFFARSAVDNSYRFNADHPFLILIRDNYSGLVLFSGRLVNP